MIRLAKRLGLERKWQLWCTLMLLQMIWSCGTYLRGLGSACESIPGVLDQRRESDFLGRLGPYGRLERIDEGSRVFAWFERMIWGALCRSFLAEARCYLQFLF